MFKIKKRKVNRNWMYKVITTQQELINQLLERLGNALELPQAKSGLIVPPTKGSLLVSPVTNPQVVAEINAERT